MFTPNSITYALQIIIDNGDLTKLQNQVTWLKNCQHGNSSFKDLVIREELVSEWCPTTLDECAGGYSSSEGRSKQPFNMTLLAYAGYHAYGRIDMVNHLLSE